MVIGRKVPQFESEELEDGTKVVVELNTAELEFENLVLKIEIKKPTNKTKEPTIIFYFDGTNQTIELLQSEIGTPRVFSTKFFSIFYKFPPKKVRRVEGWIFFLNRFDKILSIENTNDDEMGLAVFDFINAISEFKTTSNKELFLTSENLIWFDEKKQKHFLSIQIVKQFISQFSGEINIKSFANEIEVLGLKEVKSVAIRFGSGSGAVSKYWEVNYYKIKEYIETQTDNQYGDSDEPKE